MLLPKEHHQNYWKFTVNNIYKKQLILFLWKCTLYWFKLHNMMPEHSGIKSNSSSGNDQMVLFDWDWSRFMNKFSLIRSLNLFSSEARKSKWSKYIEQLLSSECPDSADCLTLLKYSSVKLEICMYSVALVKKWLYVLHNK